MEKKGLFSQRIRLRHLHTFVAVAQQGTLGRAAETLNLSQPALSKTLNELEQLTGTRLFERGRFGAQLTRSGEQFLIHALKVLDALNSASRALSHEGEPGGDIVRIGALPTAALGILPAVIGQFHHRHKEVTLQAATMSNTVLLAGLKSAGIDIGIGWMSDPKLMSGLNYEPLFMASLKLVVRPGHPLLRKTIILNQVLQWPLIIPPPGTIARQNAETLLHSRGCDIPPGCVETLSASLSRQLTIDYDYVWFVSSCAVNNDLRRGLLSALPIPMEGGGEPVGILTCVDAALSPGAQILLSAIRKSACT